MQQRLGSRILLYHVGVMASSIGSLAYTVCLMIFMLKTNYSLATVGLLLAATRLVPIFTSLLFGEIADSYSAKRIVLTIELGAGLLTLLMATAWWLGKDYFPVFFGLSVIRACAVSIQSNSRGKISKLLSSENFESNSKQAILLNKTTQGATVFAGIIAWILATQSNFYGALIFDAATYIIGGSLIIFLPKTINVTGPLPKKFQIKLMEKFRVLYGSSPKEAALDFFLALASCGATAFSARLAGNNLEWAALFMSAYGLSVWISGYLEDRVWIKKFHGSVWACLGMCFLGLGLFSGLGAITWVIFMAKDIFKWILFHRYSGGIQHNAPLSQTASVYAARNIQVSGVMAFGEYAVGSWQGVMPVWMDGAWRCAICLIIAAVTMTHFYKNWGGTAVEGTS